MNEESSTKARKTVSNWHPQGSMTHFILVNASITHRNQPGSHYRIRADRIDCVSEVLTEKMERYTAVFVGERIFNSEDPICEILRQIEDPSYVAPAMHLMKRTDDMGISLRDMRELDRLPNYCDCRGET